MFKPIMNFAPGVIFFLAGVYIWSMESEMGRGVC